MANNLVKFTKFDGEEVEPTWHVVVSLDAHRTACGYVLDGDSNLGGYESKTVSRGGITCPHCLNFIKEFKSIKL
nr:hypothetical protein [Enterovibrio norvegicus]